MTRTSRGFRIRSSLASALVGIVSLAAEARAVEPEFQMSGWWRGRYHYYDGVPVDRMPGGQTFEYFDQRMVIDPQVALGDWITLKARVDFLQDVLFGNNEAGASILTGLAKGTSSFSIGDAVSVDEADDVQVQRLWAEIATPVGLLRLGRQPSNWGLGILANSATELEFGIEGNGANAGGDTVDRAQFVTDLGKPLGWENDHWIVSVAADQASENSVDRATDDVRQFVLATLLTDGSLAPRRIVGQREIGTYTVWVTGGQWDGDAVIFDGYAHFASGPFFVEGEGVFGVGKVQRGGLIPGKDKDTLEDDLVESLSEDFYESLNGSLSLADAENYARNGFPEFLQTFVASSLLDTGFSTDAALAIARDGAEAGIPIFLHESIDVLVAGGVVRGGYRESGLTLTTEIGYSSPPDAGDDFAAPRVGPEGAASSDLNQRIVDAIDDLKGEGALTHHKFQAFPFDQEFDVAVVLYQVAGPIDPASELPTVINTTYGKVAAAYQLDDHWTIYTSGVVGWLNRPVRIVTNKLHPTDPPVFVHDEDDTNEIVTHPAFLGFELDAGVVWQPHPNIKAELKGGYLFTGDTFGPSRDDIFAIRPQLGVMF